MLAHRLATGLTLVVLALIGLVLDEHLGPWFPLWLLMASVILGATALEVVGLLDRTSARPSGNTVFGGVLALIVANWAPHIANHALNDPRIATPDFTRPIDSLAWPFWVFSAVVMFAFIAQSAQFSRPGRTMATIAGTVLAVAYVGLLGSFIIQLRWMPGPHQGLMALLTLFATAKGADTGAYTFGRIAGRHKLWPRLSPNKTIEGAFGGMVFGVGAAILVTALGRLFFDVPTLSWPAAIGYGLTVGAAAQLGDLMESMIKRDCEMKDASTTLPGFGGVLDVMDSLLFSGPVAYGYWLMFGP